ncbi:hypothetical protein QBC43DRAFT_370321 [Cladorrhinum sp. PSN259]|nr:hypothetical protein QBC43DRAFT_370321 [Cladorrhinum sp. PSN259]
MHSLTTLLTALSAGAVTAQQLCPAANNLFYQASSGRFYQINCGIEYWTKTNLDSKQPIGDPIACASACDTWTANNPSRPCAAGSWENSTNVCFLKPGDILVDKRNNTDVVSLVLTPPV